MNEGASTNTMRLRVKPDQTSKAVDSQIREATEYREILHLVVGYGVLLRVRRPDRWSEHQRCTNTVGLWLVSETNRE
jgi:hypothetical protein